MPRFLQNLAPRHSTRFVLLALFLCCVALPVLAAKKPPPKKKPAMAPVPAGKPEIFELSKHGIQRGIPLKIQLVGTNLIGLTEVKFNNPKIHGTLLTEPEATTNVAWVEVLAATNLARGAYEISVKNTNAESSKLKLYVDDLPQIYDAAAVSQVHRKSAMRPPFSFWGTLNPPGHTDDVNFEAHGGETLVFDVAARSLGSPANVMLTLFDEQNNLLASNSGLDNGDPLFSIRIPKTGFYRVRVGERMDAGSRDHIYRLSIGSFPVVVGCFPLGIPANKESDVQLIGLNLPAKSTVRVKAGAPGETDVPVDGEKFRSRRALKVVVSDKPELVASASNHSLSQAMTIPVPSAVNGRIWSPSPAPGSSQQSDADYYRFRAAPGQVLVMETDAARRGSPMDTKIEVLHPDGSPVQRVELQAVRDSHLTFRNIDSNTDDLRVENWQEMELNQYMYLQGEVCKIFRMPQGPDSGFQFYNSGGRRRLYFDTSPVAHALDEPIYIVEPHPPGTQLVPNGLPVFTINYVNDDDSLRQLGADSRLFFTVPPSPSTNNSANGLADYLVRVTDTRGFSGERFAYRLMVREAQPDFRVSLGGANPTVNAGSGREFSVSADRIDSFDGDIVVELTNVPSGFFVSSPIVIQAGHSVATGVVFAETNAVWPMATNLVPIKVTASALVPAKPTWPGSAPEEHPIPTRTVTKDVNSLGKITVADKAKLFVELQPYDERDTNFVHHAVLDKPFEITVVPGHSVPAWLKVERNGHDDLINFSVENLPHGVIVDNIGLNGVLIPKGDNARQIFLTAARWVPDTDCLCFAKSAQVENQTSFPLLLHVRRANAQASVNH